MKKVFYKKGQEMDALSVAGEDCWQYSAYGVKADVFIRGDKAEIPVIHSKHPNEGNFKKWLNDMEKEFKVVQFNSVISPILKKYLIKRGYKLND